MITVTWNLTADCIKSINNAGSIISDDVLMRNVVKMIPERIREKKVKENWPPAPRDLMICSVIVTCTISLHGSLTLMHHWERKA